MKKQYAIALLILFPLAISARNYYVFGHVANKLTKEHLPFVNVSLLRPDSSVVSSSVSTNGHNNQFIYTEFRLHVQKEGKYIVRCSMIGYETIFQNIDVIFSKRTERIDVGTIYMREAVRMLKGVTVKATKIKMVMKGDTVVYNADAFQLSEGSMLDALIEQLPGVELKDNGRILVNGKYVESLLLNGKDFFKGNPKIALENLPAYMIHKVKVYEKAGNMSKLMGRDMRDKQLVMDVNLKKEYSIGWIANAEIGGGNKERFLGRLFALRFTKLSRLTAFANFNNLNDKRRPGRSGNWSPADMPDGLLTLKTAGLSYRFEGMNETYAITSDNIIEHRDGTNEETSFSETFLGDGNLYSRKHNISRDKHTQFTSENGFYCRPKNMFLNGRYAIDYTHYNNTGMSRLANFTEYPSRWDKGNVLDSLFSPNAGVSLRKIIASRQSSDYLGSGNRFNTNLHLQNSIRLKHDHLTLDAGAAYAYADNTYFNHYKLDYPEASVSAKVDYRNQYRTQPSHSYNMNFSALYSYRPNDNIMIDPYYGYAQAYQSDKRSWYRLETLPDWGEDSRFPLGTLPSAELLQRTIDVANSYDSELHRSVHNVGIRLYNYKQLKEGGNLDIQCNLPLSFERNRLAYLRALKSFPIVRHTLFFEPKGSVRLKTKNRDEYAWSYKLSSAMPATTYLIGIRDDSDPLNIYYGNEGLKNSHHHETEVSYSKNWSENSQFLNAKLSFDVTENAVAIGFAYDAETSVRTYRPENVNGNYHLGCGFGFGRTLDKKRRFFVSTQTDVNFYHSVDVVGVLGATTSMRSVVSNLYLSEVLKLDYRLNKALKMGAKFAYNLVHVASARTDFETINANSFNYGLTAQAELPWALQLSTDITEYSRRGYSDPSLNTNELVWNVRLSRSIMKGNLTFMLDGFDILGNLSNVRRTLNAQGRTETYYNVIPSYMMLHVLYKLNKQPKKKGAK